LWADHVPLNINGELGPLNPYAFDSAPVNGPGVNRRAKRSDFQTGQGFAGTTHEGFFGRATMVVHFFEIRASLPVGAVSGLIRRWFLTGLPFC
jgi:hypothetical protein